MRIFTAKDGVNLNHLFLPFQGLKVMSDPDQVHLFWQFVSRVAPITVGKDAKLAARDKAFQTFLQI